MALKVPVWFDQQKFANYIAANKGKIDNGKIKNLSTADLKEFQQTWSLPSYYFIPKNTSTATSNTTSTPNATSSSNTISSSNTGVWSSTITSTNNSNMLGWVHEWNIMANKLESTINAFNQSQKQWWEDKAKLEMQAWEQKRALEEEYNKEQRARIAEQEKLSAEIAKQAQKRNEEINQFATQRADARAKEADDLLKAQHDSAARRANAAVAAAWQTWVQMSEWAQQDVYSDAFAKFDEWINNAAQFRTQTKMTLDQALTQVFQNSRDNEIMNLWRDRDNKVALNESLKQLSDAEKLHVLNAITAATKWNTDAIDAITENLWAILKKKQENEAAGMNRYEMQEDQQTQWVNMNQRQKWDFLAGELWDKAYIMDAYWANPSKYNKMSFREAVTTMEKQYENLTKMLSPDMLSALTAWAQVKAADPNAKMPSGLEAALNKIWVETETHANLTQQTAEKKADARWDTWRNTTDILWVNDFQSQFKYLSWKDMSELDAISTSPKKNDFIKLLKQKVNTTTWNNKLKLQESIVYLENK